MLFVALLEAHPATAQERIDRRLEWEYPEGTKVIAEYWLQTPDPQVILVFEAEHMGQAWALTGPWNDVFEITVYPAVTAKEGLELLK